MYNLLLIIYTSLTILHIRNFIQFIKRKKNPQPIEVAKKGATQNSMIFRLAPLDTFVKNPVFT